MPYYTKRGRFKWHSRGDPYDTICLLSGAEPTVDVIRYVSKLLLLYSIIHRKWTYEVRYEVSQYYEEVW